ncbi:MAG: hypothetical protein IKO19_12930 [Candidatus Riflebacteria bacterium]|nr:hypothetical protein [Candidatus Riflebacteria bacterium]
MTKKLNPGLYATIDIGTKSVKAVVIEVNDKSKRLLNAESIELAAFDTFTNEDDYKKQITDSISKLVEKLDLTKCQKVISLFYNREFQVKLIDFPNNVKLEQLNQMLFWEAKKLLSSHYKEKEFSYSYCITRGNPLSVVLAVVPQTLLDAHLKLFENTGITPTSVYTDVFSSLALQPIIDIAGLPALSIVNFGHSGTHLNIFSAGKLKFYRFIPTGTAEMSNPPRENELEVYSQKIRFSFDYFRAVSKLTQVDALFFMGGGSAIPNVLNFEQNYFSPTKINALDVSSEIDISPIISVSFNEEVNTENSLKLLPFVPAIGGCLADFREDSDNLDLLTLLKNKEKEKRLAKLAQTIPLFVGIIALLIGLSFIYFLYTNKKEKLDNLTIEKNSIQSQIEINDTKISSLSSQKSKYRIKLNPQSMKLVKPIISSKYQISNLFIRAMSVRPKEMKLENILIRNRSEAEQITLKTEDNDENLNSGMEQEKTSPYLSQFSSEINEEQIKEDISGNIAIIHGYADNQEQVSRFSESLNTQSTDKIGRVIPKVLKRYISINMRKTRDRRIEFLLKGEL